MRAVRIAALGSPVVDAVLPDPQPGPDDVVVRVHAAGICHSDAHYRSGRSPLGYLPITPGHEVAGTVESVGDRVDGWRPGQRACLHYLISCGSCAYCARGTEQFCLKGRMIGKHADGGWAQLVCVPARSLVPLPDGLSFQHGAALMCSSSTSYHALRKARLAAGETVAVIGAGGLGLSAVQIARAMGAARVFAVDVNPDRLSAARELGGLPVDARQADPVAAIRSATRGAGVDVAVELVGSPVTMTQAVSVLGVFGRAALAGITNAPVQLDTYRDLIGREAEVIGVSDHLRSELASLLDMACRGALDLRRIVTQTVPLAASRINAVLDDLEAHRAAGRTVIDPTAGG